MSVNHKDETVPLIMPINYIFNKADKELP